LNQDFTYGKNFADFLGSFWTQLFDNGALGDAIGYANSETLVQGYADLMEIISTLSVNTVPVFSKKKNFPLSILKSNFLRITEIPKYGSGGFFGLQPSTSKYLEGIYLRYGQSSLLQEPFFYPINNPMLRDLGDVALNRLFEPSSILTKNTDFIFVPEGVIFNKNIFENELFPRREIINVETGEIDEELVVWFCDVTEDKEYIFNQYGYLFSNYRKSTEDYKRAMQSIFKLISSGPSLFKIDSFLSAISGSPIIREPQETVEKITQSQESLLIITDKNVYSVDGPEDLRPSIVVGATLIAGTPISNAVEIVDTKQRFWWQKFLSIPVKKGATSNTNSYVAFPNKLEPAKYGKLMFLGNGLSRSLQFNLIGSKEAVEKFWNNVYQKSKAKNLFYGYELFKKYSSKAISLETQTKSLFDPEKTENQECGYRLRQNPINGVELSNDFINKEIFLINPAQVFADDLASGAILPIKININKIQDLEFFFGIFNPVTSNCPVHLTLMLFFASELTEIKDLKNEVKIVENIDLRDFLSQRVENYPVSEQNLWNFDTQSEDIKEGLSWGKSFGNIAQASDPNYYDRVIEYFDLSNASNLVQNIELKLVKKCKQ
jgi:hypothetical protein